MVNLLAWVEPYPVVATSNPVRPVDANEGRASGGTRPSVGGLLVVGPGQTAARRRANSAPRIAPPPNIAVSVASSGVATESPVVCVVTRSPCVGSRPLPPIHDLKHA